LHPYSHSLHFYGCINGSPCPPTICKYKAITKELKHARTKCNYKANAKCKTSNKSTDY
jgi:hypothetical protein